MRARLMLLAMPLIARARAFWLWWRETLEDMLPPEALARIHPRRAIIRPGRTYIEIDLIDNEDGRTLREARPLEALDDAAWDELTDALTDRQIVAILPESEGFSARVTLPRAAQRRPDAAVALQLPAIAPLDADHLVWTWQLVDRSTTTLTLMVYMVRRAYVETVQQTFAMRGLVPPPIALQTAAGAVPIAPGTKRWRGPAAQRQRLMTWVALALFASVPFSTWLGATALLAIDEPTLQNLRVKVAPKLLAWRKAQRAETLRQAMQPLAEAPMFSAIVNDLSAALPAGVYMTALEVDTQGTVRIALAGAVDPQTVRALQTHIRLLDIDDVTVAADAAVIELVATMR